MSKANPSHWRKPPLERRKPQRGPANLYRTADNGKTGLGGVTLEAAEDATLAFVSMGYNFIDGEIERIKRNAGRAKAAADRRSGYDPADEGEQSAEDAVNGAERLVNNAMMAGMMWVERILAAENGLAPQLAAAQFRAVKSVLFGSQRDATDDTGDPGGPRAERSQAATGPPVAPEITSRDVRILLQAPKSSRRAVRIVRWDVEGPVDAELSFRFVGATTSRTSLEALLTTPNSHDPRPTLTMIATPTTAPSGIWRAAVCDRLGEQHGIVEIEL